MQVRPVGEAQRSLDCAAGAGLGQRQAGQLRLAVDQHGAHAAGALAATELGRHVADAAAQRVEQVLPAVDEHRLVGTVEAELHRCLGHGRS